MIQSGQNFFNEKLKTFLESFLRKAPSALKKSIQYSLLGGGKRIRPLLTFGIAEAFGWQKDLVLNWAIAVEMIHTYSLIHDDLPCMDNDDFRRGEPTNHKKFDEATALLAGDALLSDAFRVILESQTRDENKIKLIHILSSAAGSTGMVGGQAFELSELSNRFSEMSLAYCQDGKTGKLIQTAALGAGVLCELGEEQIQQITLFGELFGKAFQLADDLEDEKQDAGKSKSWIDLWGSEKCLQTLNMWTEELKTLNSEFPKPSELLYELIYLNYIRIAPKNILSENNPSL